jgi:hypothetical protein
MPTKPTLDGNKAVFIFKELDYLTADVQTQLLNLLEKIFANGGNEQQMKLVVRALQSSTTAQRIATLLRQGQYQEAEDVVLGSNR